MPASHSRPIEYCLEEAGSAPDELDYVAFYDKPLTKFERLLETYLGYAPAGLAAFSLAMPVWLKKKLFTRKTIAQSCREASRADTTLPRPSREPRRQRVLSEPIRGRRNSHARWRRRMEHDHATASGTGQQDCADAPPAISALARACSTPRSPTTAASK